MEYCNLKTPTLMLWRSTVGVVTDDAATAAGRFQLTQSLPIGDDVVVE